MRAGLAPVVARLRSLWYGVRHRRTVETEMQEEFRLHLELRAEDLARGGLTPAEARRQARLEFGSVEMHKDTARQARGLRPFDELRASALDFKLGVRMLAKYPGLTLAGTIGLTVAVAIGGVAFRVLDTIVDPSLPLHEGDRIVAIQNVSAAKRDEVASTHLHDLDVWRASLPAVGELGVYRTVDRNVVTPDGRVESLRTVEMSASGFRVARVPAALGRFLTDDDGRPDAPAVVVIGHDVWQGRFGGRADVVGQPLRLGTTPHTVVGVMPRGFGFPVNNRVWTPLRLRPDDYPPGDAPAVDVFGRLAPGATLADAESQLATIGRRLAAAEPHTHGDVRPRVMPYARAFLDAPELAWVFYLLQLFMSLLLVAIGVNVAVLVYARTVTRAGEIAMRTALGATRARVVTQLFAEALVLSSVAAALGMVAAHLVLRRVAAGVAQWAGEQVPFWWDFRLSVGTLAYASVLAVVAAAIVGVLPALRVTGRRARTVARAGGGSTAPRLGRTWTALIVAQVAVAVALLPLTLHVTRMTLRAGYAPPGYASAAFLTARLHVDRSGALDVVSRDSAGDARADRAHAASAQAELVRRLTADPRVADVVLSTAVAGGEPNARIEVADATVHTVGVNRVEPDYFRAFGVPVTAGRLFGGGDLASGATAVVVNRAFTAKVLGGRPALGQRVRYVRAREDVDAGGGATREPWYEIVGEVANFPDPGDPIAASPRLYRPLAPGAAEPVIAIHVRGAPPATFGDPLRAIALDVDPMLRLTDVASFASAVDVSRSAARLAGIVVPIVTLSVLLLSAAGIYALVSVTVTRRRREIGIRAALGGRPVRVVAVVLSTSLRQLAIGVVVGTVLAALADVAMGRPMLRGPSALLLPGVALGALLLTLVAAIGPARRALAVQPTDVLREDG